MTAPPAVSFIGTTDAGAAAYAAYARGAAGAGWVNDHDRSSGWAGWIHVGGALLAGTSPAVAYLSAGPSPYLLAVGTNGELYLEWEGQTGFQPAGGRTTATPALTAISASSGHPAALAAFARGTGNVGYCNRFPAPSGFPAITPAWHTMGGRLTSGLGATTQVINSVPYTVTAGLGTDQNIYANDANWSTYPPALTGWHRVR